jgi:uncharacterized protein with HEPN domain
MSRHDDATRLRHMLDAARLAVVLCRDRTRDDLERDKMLSLALARLIEWIGEAANSVSEEKRRSMTTVR